MVFLFVSTGLIIGLSVAAAVVIVGVLVLLNFTVFANLRMKKQVREFAMRFEYSHGLLFGQDAQYIKRIENISITNLTYSNTHQMFNKRFKELRDKYDSGAQVEMNRLKDLVSDHDFKGLKSELPIAKNAIDAFENEVNLLNQDLERVIAPEEECRQASLAMKEKFRKIKQDFNVRQADLSLAVPSFEQAFGMLDENFKNFESLIESAHYEEAKAMLPKIGGVIDALGKAIKEMPNLCITIQSVIPERLTSLEDKYEDLIQAGYPLGHLLTKTNLQSMRRDLETLSEQVKNFNIAGVSQRLDAILARIEDFFNAFDKEKEARLVFDAEIDRVYREDSTIEKRYIRLCNAMPELKEVYFIPDRENEKIDQIKALINRAGATKRSLDTLIHAGTRQPYTTLVDKMRTLDDESRQASQAIEDFNRYLLSLKQDSEEASRALYEYNDKIHKAWKSLRAMSIDAVTEKYSDRLLALQNLLDEIYSKLKKPIDLVTINELVHRLKAEGDDVCRHVEQDHEDMLYASASIVFANRDRLVKSDIRVAVKQAESLYLKGDFKESYALMKAAVQSAFDAND